MKKYAIAQINTSETKTYQVREHNNDGFRVDITIDKDHRTPGEVVYEAWLYHKDYGVKQHMFGCSASVINYVDFCNEVERDLWAYIDKYNNDVMAGG